MFGGEEDLEKKFALFSEGRTLASTDPRKGHTGFEAI